jgi:hypothetical protein
MTEGRSGDGGLLSQRWKALRHPKSKNDLGHPAYGYVLQQTEKANLISQTGLY